MKTFAKLTKSEKRIQIAKDVLRHIKTKRIAPANCVIVERDLLLNNSGKELQKVFEKAKGCEACAVGSLFLSLIDRENECLINDKVCGFNRSGDFKLRDYSLQRLSKYFDKKQIFVIENAFESGSGMFSKRTKIGKRYFDLFDVQYTESYSTFRLVAIMLNIIKNGEFKVNMPPDINEVRKWVKENIK